MGATTVNGNLKDAGFSNYASQVIYFRLKSAGTDSAGTTVVARNRVSVTTDASGDFSISLWCNGLSDIASVYEVTLPDGERKEFIIPSSSDGGSIEFDRLLALHQPDGTSQIATLGDVFLQEANNLSDLGNVVTARSNLGLAIGTDVQAWDAGLQSISGISPNENQMIYTSAPNVYTTTALTAAGRALLDDANASAQRTTLGLAIGSDVQGWDAQLDGIAAITPSDKGIIRGNGTGWQVANSLRVDTGFDNDSTEMGTGSAIGGKAVAWGFNTLASGDNCFAGGYLSTASNFCSFAVGIRCEATKEFSSATGRQAKALHNGAKVEADSQVADVSSTTTNQYTARFQNGYEFKGGSANFDGNISYVNPIVKPSTSTTLTAGSQVKVSQTASGITTTLWASASDGQEVTIHNYSGGDNTIAAAAGIKSSSAGTDTSVTIFNNEVLKFIYDGTNWLLTT